MSLHLRAMAAQATFDAYNGQRFRWGRRDCFRMAAHTLRGLGHKPNLARFGAYANERDAARALLRNGFHDVSEVLDKMGLPRIAPAAALVADILGFKHPDQGLITGLSVHLGNHRVLAFLGDDPEHRAWAVEPSLTAPGVEVFAWRCEPCLSSSR